MKIASLALGISQHGAMIMQTGVTCKKIPIICATQLAVGLLLKKPKHVKHF